MRVDGILIAARLAQPRSAFNADHRQGAKRNGRTRTVVLTCADLAIDPGKRWHPHGKSE